MGLLQTSTLSRPLSSPLPTLFAARGLHRTVTAFSPGYHQLCRYLVTLRSLPWVLC